MREMAKLEEECEECDEDLQWELCDEELLAKGVWIDEQGRFHRLHKLAVFARLQEKYSLSDSFLENY